MENPELELIDRLASQIDEDERLVEGLGSGTLSLRDLEAWRQRRWEAERRFLQETGELIKEMRRQGFSKTMAHSEAPRDGRRGGRKAKLAGARRGKPFAADGAPEKRERRFVLELYDLGLPCTLTVSGSYESVLDAGVWHARHIHHLRGSVASLREAVKSAMREEAVGIRPPAAVSDEAANMTRGSGFASA